MAQINTHYNKLSAGYLFPEIARRTETFLKKNPAAKVKKLGIGNTTESITPTVIEGLKKGVIKLSKNETYTGYGSEQGSVLLREKLVSYYALLGVKLSPDEFFISDGAKSDSGNIQSIFSHDSIIAFQDPAYPVYIDSNVIAGRSRGYNTARKGYDDFIYMPCTKENNFIPEVPEQKVDLIYLCSPNNPTGAAATRTELKRFVDYARKNKAVILYDAAYAEYISDPELPKTIFEIEGAKECSIEINSLSKFAGFTGVRLGWSIVPRSLVVEGTDPGEIQNIWNRRQCTFFNGASNIVQEGALAVFSEKGLKESRNLVNYYMQNARIIKKEVESIGLHAFGGVNSPYIWMETPEGLSSWDFFDKLLAETGVIGTPGSGFGPAGEGYFRLSAFGHHEDINEAVESIKSNLHL